MSAPHGHDARGPTLCLFRSEAGEVSVCRCGVVTLTMQYVSLRFEPDAFRSLTQLLMQAHARRDRVAGPASAEPDADSTLTPATRSVH